jgi:hypothetical protein
MITTSCRLAMIAHDGEGGEQQRHRPVVGELVPHLRPDELDPAQLRGIVLRFENRNYLLG